VTGVAPAPSRIDRQQLAALLAQSLRETLRPGVDAHTGLRGSPLKQLAFSMTLMGIVFATNLPRLADLRSFLVLLFAMTMGTVLLGVAPESHEARLKRLEILYSKPISTRTFLAVRVLVLVVLAGLIASFLALPPLLAAGLRFGRWGLLAGQYGLLVVGSFALVVLWLAVFQRLAARVSLGRLRRITQTVLAVMLLAVVGLTFSTLPARVLGQPLPPPISLETSSWVRLLPSTWFVDVLMGGGGPAALGERFAALALLALALTLLWVLDVDLVASAERLMAPPTQRITRPPAVRIYELLGRLPLVGERLAGGPVGALTVLLLTVTQRDEVTRMKSLGPRLLQVVMFVLAWRARQPALFLAMLAYVGLVGLIEGLRTLRQSSEAAATWLLHVAPLDGGQLMRAVRRGALLRLFLFPSLLLAAVALRVHPAHEAAVLWLGYFALASLLIAASVLVTPRIPLSGEPSASPGVAGFAAATTLGLAGLVAYGLFIAVVTMLGWIGAVVGAMAAASLLVVAHVVGHFAGRRLGALEHLH
jgi:hypothetical protein